MKTLFIEPGSPWENGYVESFNGKLRDELLEREAFDTLLEAKVLFRSLAAARQHDPTTQCLGLSPPGHSRRFERFHDKHRLSRMGNSLRI